MKLKLWGWLTDIALYSGGIVMLLPFVWMVVTSLKSGNDALLWTIIPTHLEWSNYSIVFSAIPLTTYLMNSVIVVVTSTFIGVVITIMAAFAFSRLHFYGKKTLLAIMLATLMVPEELLLIPNFMTVAHLGWIDRYEALIVPWMTNAFSVFLLFQHFSSIPAEYYYAARVDGGRPLVFLWRILVPIASPMIATLFLMKAIACWNTYLWPMLVTNHIDMRTLQAGMLAFSTENGTSYELLMASSTLTLLPMVIVYMLLQKRIIHGITQIGRIKND